MIVIGPRPLGYAQAVALQQDLRTRVAHGRAAAYLLMVEHPPTITVGRGGTDADVIADRAELAARRVEVFACSRGGEVTFHGPGQLVAYPILDLSAHGRDIHAYLRTLEGWLVDLCRTYGIDAHADSPHTGVWVRGGPGADRKIASIGVAVRRWITYHGVALNVDIDLDWFRLIVPCGMPHVTMTSMAAERGRAPALEDVAQRAAGALAARYGMVAVRAAEQALEKR
jgi:lipoate-protein ligase B